MSLADNFRVRGIGVGDWIVYRRHPDRGDDAVLDGDEWQVRALGKYAALVGDGADEFAIGGSDGRYRDYDHEDNWQPTKPPVPVTWTDGTDERWGTSS